MVVDDMIFFSLLRYSIGASGEFPLEITEGMWHDIYRMAQQQSLLGVLFDGIQRNAQSRPPRDLLLKWYAISERIRKRNMMMNALVVDLEKYLMQNGFSTCILKGQGNTLNYPNSYIRTSGDIDVWVKKMEDGRWKRADGGRQMEDGRWKMEDGRWKREEMFVKEAIMFARRRCPDAKACYHHVDAGAYKGVEVEIHYRPSFMNNMIHNKRMQRWFEEVKEEQFSHRVELPDGAGSICVPTHAFNRIYQLAHIYKHIIHEGIGLRQFVDYYFVLKHGFTEEERVADEMLLKSLGLYHVAAAVMYVLKEVLHLDDSLLLVPVDERRGKFLLKEIMLSGNFGQYDQRVHGFYRHTSIGRNIERIRRDARLVWSFPSECMWEPVFRVYHYFWRLKNAR